MITVNNSALKTELPNIDNLRDDPFDFIPSDVENEGDKKPRKILVYSL